MEDSHDQYICSSTQYTQIIVIIYIFRNILSINTLNLTTENLECLATSNIVR